MNDYQNIFRRIEKKYILTQEQYLSFRKVLSDFTIEDDYGNTPILNIYYDRPDFYLIHKSMEKPMYKEKLRLRCYGIPGKNSSSFVEIKKKCENIVYKRRVCMPYEAALTYLNNPGYPQKRLPHSHNTNEQILREIDFMKLRYTPLLPKMTICYDRIALMGIDDPNLRITFDKNIRWRSDHLDLRNGNSGTYILPPDYYLMEIKIVNSIPLTLSRILSRYSIFSTSFSKYGYGYLAYETEKSSNSPARQRADNFLKEKSHSISKTFTIPLPQKQYKLSLNSMSAH